MNKKEVEQFKRDLIAAFDRRTVGTTSLEIMRLLDRFEPDIREKMRAEWLECTNPEQFLHPDTRDDFEFANAGAITLILMEVAAYNPEFAPTDEQWAELRKIDDRWEARGEPRVFTHPKVSYEDDDPSGMR